MTTSSARSIHGCWTCRVRKKKCDENRPGCFKCASLSLECHGYGDRPVWMDNGPLQKEQALRIKRIVGQNNPKRRKRRSQHSPSLPFPDMDTAYDKSAGSIAASSSYSSSEEVPPTGSNLATAVSADWSQLHDWNTDLDICENYISNEFPQENIFNTESLFGNLDWDNSIWVDDGSLSGQDLIPSEPSTVSQHSDILLTPTPNTPASNTLTSQNCSILDHTTYQEGPNQGAIGASEAKWPSSSHTTLAQSLSANQYIKECDMVSSYPEDSVMPRDMEDDLLMHYLDEVFYIQYPFYNFPNKQSRGWLLSSIKRTRSAYHATLALSQRHLQSTAEISLRSRLSNKPSYNIMALQEMEVTMDKSSSSRKGASITCVLQVIFYELFAGGTGDWQKYILAAIPLILPLVQPKTSFNGHSSTGSNFTATHEQHEKVMSLGDNMEAKVLLGSFICLDIIASASTRSPPSFDLDHKYLLNTFHISLESLFGCGTRVMILILDIVYLDNWKKEAEKFHQLSLVELVKRGARIEESLRQELVAMKSEHSLESHNSTLSTAQTDITSIFALSALTYLHVVISGAHPELPEIVESISKTINALKCLTEPRLLRNLVWPFCVTGCLAAEEQQDFLRELVSKAEITPFTIGTCFQAFKIVEECWEMRKTRLHNCDWAFIMNRRGYNVLLI